MLHIVYSSENGGEHFRVGVIVAKNSLFPTTPVNFLVSPLYSFSHFKILCELN